MAGAPHLSLLLPHLAEEFDPRPPSLWSHPSPTRLTAVDPNSGSDYSGSDYSDDDHAPLSLDLFRSRIRPTVPEPFGSPVFWVSDDPHEIGAPVSLGLSLGFGPRFTRDVDDEDAGERVDRVAVDWTTDDLFLGRRSPASEPIAFSGGLTVAGFDSDSDSDDHPASEPIVFLGGLRVAGFDSDSDSDEHINEQIVADMGMDSDDGEGQYRLPDDLSLPFCWDGLQLGDGGRDANEGFEWEEIDGHDGERDELAINIMVLDNDGRSDENRRLDSVEVEHEDVVRNVDWEVLLAVNNLGRSPFDSDDAEVYFEDGLVYTSDYEPYEVLFGQFVEEESNAKGSPPAAKLVVENLPSVVITKESGVEIDAVCAVCKDQIVAEERVKKLPCLHHYHEECIVPWLRIRNTCPLCRFELPTDDPEYEKQRARRTGSVVSRNQSQLRYDFEVLPEA